MHLFLVNLLLLFSLAGCSCFDSCSFWAGGDSSPPKPRYDVPEAPHVDLPNPVLSIHGQEVTAIVQGLSVNFKHSHHLYLDHAYTYYNDAGIQTIQLQYHTQMLVDVCDARKLIIDLSGFLLSALNQNPFLLPEFAHGFFSPYNLEIYIEFESYYLRYVDPYYIKWICMEDGMISYYAADLDDNDKSCWHVRRESYPTSHDIVLYQRIAENTYDLEHQLHTDVFGNKRYYPEGDNGK